MLPIKYHRSNGDRKHYNHYPTNYTKVPDVNSLSANTTDGKGSKDNKNKAISTIAKLLPKLFILTLGSDFHLRFSVKVSWLNLSSYNLRQILIVSFEVFCSFSPVNYSC
jgi:hypothetical protein